MPWPELLAFWGMPNLRVINREAHAAKSSAETTARRKIAVPVNFEPEEKPLSASEQLKLEVLSVNAELNLTHFPA